MHGGALRCGRGCVDFLCVGGSHLLRMFTEGVPCVKSVDRIIIVRTAKSMVGVWVAGV